MGRNTEQNSICAAATVVSINGQNRPAREWAALRGLKWQTVKMRRYRGTNWDEAFAKLHQGGRLPIRGITESLKAVSIRLR